ncbi:MAG: N-acetylmuramoyl-L-alanine amidase [Clostridiales bacterium]|nr:N-acetylmuramoyl-L-alanine amidase [Clostridiales bacterium]
MSKSTSNRPQNDIPEDEQPLGGVYDEDKESDQIDSIKDNISDIKDRTLDTKDDIEDLINRFKGDQEDYSSSYDSQYRDNEATKTNENSKEESNGNSKNKDLKEDASERGERNRSSGLKNEGKSGHHSPNTAKPGNTGSNGIANASNATNIRPGVGGVGATGTGTAGATTAGATSAGATTAGAASAGATSAGSTAVAAAAPALPIILIVILVVILVIGIIGFFTVMPGMILGKLKKFGFRILEGLKGATTGNSKIVTQEELKGVAQYIQNLGYDIQSYGFADVKYKKPTKKDLEDNKVSSNKEISKIVPVNRDLANDYLSAYITADAQTYVAADTFLFAKVINAWDNIRALMNNDELKSIDQSSSGLINILNHKIPFINSKDTIDNAEDYAVVNTEKRKLYINTKVFTINIPILSELSTAVLGKNKAKVQIRRGSSYSFDLESWTAMYGRPLELFIALHTSTMMPDLSQKIATGSDFNTKVNIELLKSKMTYDIEINSKEGKTVKFSHDTDKYSESDEPILNARQFVENFLTTAIEPEDKGLYKKLINHVENIAREEDPSMEFAFFYEIWRSGEKSQGWFDFDGKLNYRKAADKVLTGEATFEFEEEDGEEKNTLATMKKDHGPITIGGVEFSGSQYFELAQLIAKGMTPQDMLYPIIKDVTNHWFYGTIDFMGTNGKVSHGAYRRARIVEKRIKYASDAAKDSENSSESQYDDIIFDDIQDMIDRGITQEDIDKYENGKVKDAINKYNEKETIHNNDLDNPGNTGAISPDKAEAEKNKLAHEHTLAYLKDMYKKQTEGTSTTEEGSTKADEKTALQAAFDIYLDTKMRAIDGDSGIFYQASEPELLGPSDHIKKVFSKSYYQYDGTAETAKKIAAARSIDKGSDKYYYGGEEYSIEQEDIEEKGEAAKARKAGDVENEYYSSPMVKKKVNFDKNKKIALQALAMLESMKTHASDEAYKNIKELLYSLEYFTEEELTTNTKQTLLWIADNGEVTGHEKWQTENVKTNSKAERDDNTKYNLVVKNLKQSNMKIVAPENATASYTSEDGGILTLSFIEMSQDTYDILNYKYNGLKDVKGQSYTGSFTKINKNLLTGYTMKIKGIKDPGKTEFKRGETIVEVENGMTDFGNEDNGKVEISLINEEGSPHDSIEEYMKSDYTKTDEENLKKQMQIEKESLERAGYKYTGSASTLTSEGGLGSGSGGNSEGIDFGAGNYTEFNLTNAEEKALNEEQKAFLIYMYLTERGLTPNQAAGIIGNAYQETTLLTNKIWGYEGPAMGMFQHTDDEQTALKKLLKERGKSFENQSLIEDQLDFMLGLIIPQSGDGNWMWTAGDTVILGSAKRLSAKDKQIMKDNFGSYTTFAIQETLFKDIKEGDALYNEFKGYENEKKKYKDMFFEAPSPETAATAFERGYERPDTGGYAYDNGILMPQAFNHVRRRIARKYFDKFTNQAEIDRIKASLPKQPTTHDSRAFVARTVQGGTVAGDSGAGANTAALANGTEIGLDSNWKYANFSKIHTGKAKFYKTTATNPNGIVITVNAGHGTSGGSSQKTQTHPDGTAKVTGGTTKAGAKESIAISEGMTFSDGATEAEINLKVALKLRDKLLAKGYNVLMIRETSDVQLDNIARTVIANNNSHAHIAIHYDSSTSDKGAFYMQVPDVDSYKKMYPVSTMWQRHDRLGNSLISGLKEKNVKIFGKGKMEMDLTQTSYSTIPSVDIELGDKITDHDDAENDKRAEGLLAGINKYFDI